MHARDITDDASEGPVLEGADTPERLLERLGFPRPRQLQLVSFSFSKQLLTAARVRSSLIPAKAAQQRSFAWQ